MAIVYDQHRRIAIDTFNKCWDLLEQPRSVENDRELLTNAFTSRFHWRAIGGPQEFSISEWMISRVFARLGQGDLAIEFAQAALDLLTADAPYWHQASTHEGLARAYLAAGDSAQAQVHIHKCQELLTLETNDDDAKHIRSQLAELL